MTARLPAGLSAWADPLSLLDPHLAVAIGPMVRQLDQLFSRRTTADHPEGEMDGYGGLSRRGDPSRLVMSEWSLADEQPLEFVRRAVDAELLYLAPNLVQDRHRGRVVVLVDCGPDQLGAGRLVQLAALIVTSRRAASGGAGFCVGILGDEPGSWLAGDLSGMLRGWLGARRADPPLAADIDAWTSGVDRADECWLLVGGELARQLPGRHRMMVTAECAWGSHGATAVEVRIDGDRIELPLPPGDVAVRALRGAAFRVDSPPVVESTSMRRPGFSSAQPQLLGRGRDATELIAVQVPSPGGRPGRPKRHQFAGPVLAAAHIGRRLVVLAVVDDDIRVVVRGKHLGRVDRITTSLLALDLDLSIVDTLAELALPTMVFDAGDLVVRLNDVWWRLSPDDEPRSGVVCAAQPTDSTDRPRLAWSADGRFWASPESLPSQAAEVILGPRRLIAWREGENRWHLEPTGGSVNVPDGESVLGLTVVDGVPALLTQSAAGLIARLRRPGDQRTLTKWSGGMQPPALHPTRPWIAVQRNDSRIEVADLDNDALLMIVPGTI